MYGPLKVRVDSGKPCRDCAPSAKRRPTPYPGPRCHTHHVARVKAVTAARKAAYVEKTYSLTDEQYWALYDYQGGRCYICQRAKGQNQEQDNGIRKRLSVDHDHACCSGAVSCGKCVRGLLCKPCNRDVLGHLRDDPAAFERGREYVLDPPAKRLFQLT
jgi:hypothetical protein